jgi:membrane fusion protein, adhesin transport system
MMNQVLPALADVRTPRSARTLARLLVGLFTTLSIGLLSVPWQQTSFGKGRVVAYAPVDRQQDIEAPISSRVVRWHVQEGTIVKKGDLLVELADNDPEILERLRNEREAIQATLSAAQAELFASLETVQALEKYQENVTKVAQAKIKIAHQKVKAARQVVLASQAVMETNKIQHERQKALFAKGLVSSRDAELAALAYTKSALDVQKAQASQAASQNDALAASADQLKAQSEALSKRTKAQADAAKAQANIAKANEKLAKIEVRLARQLSQKVHAPRDGTILRVIAKQGTVMVKAGQPLAVLVPNQSTQAVELWIHGNDVPLVQPGAPVRLQFEGWPALQFSGWPSIAVGTFGGTIAVVDAADDGKGNFRVLVTPDPKEPWPTQQYLRQGLRGHGWILLNRVPLGYELWRRWNGFPPALPDKAKANYQSSKSKAKSVSYDEEKSEK